MEKLGNKRVMASCLVNFTLRFCTLAFVFCTVFNSVQGLPATRSYDSYNSVEDTGPRRLSSLGSGFGSGSLSSLGHRGLGEHSSWCPLRRRDSTTSDRSIQRLPNSGRSKGSGYYNYASYDDSASRFGRSQRGSSNVRPISNNFRDVDISEVTNSGTNVGGILWPRRSTASRFDDDRLSQSANSDDDQSGCNHFRVAALAKDATAAAADAVAAAAAAAKAAAVAAAAAACTPEGHSTRSDDSEDDSQDDTDDSDENLDSKPESQQDDFKESREMDLVRQRIPNRERMGFPSDHPNQNRQVDDFKVTSEMDSVKQRIPSRERIGFPTGNHPNQNQSSQDEMKMSNTDDQNFTDGRLDQVSGKAVQVENGTQSPNGNMSGTRKTRSSIDEDM